MKYLKAELYETDTINSSPETDDAWKSAYFEYMNQYSMIQKKLPKNFTEYYGKKHLHDCQLLLFRIDQDKQYGKTSPSLIFEWKEPSKATAFTIEYCGLQEFHCTNMGKYSLYPQDYLYGEILGNEMLSHEFVLDTGVVFYIRFQKLKFTLHKP